MLGSWSTKCPALTEKTNWTENRHQSTQELVILASEKMIPPSFFFFILRLPKDLFESGKGARETKIKTGERGCSSSWLNYFRLFWRKSFLLVLTPVTPVLAPAENLRDLWLWWERSASFYFLDMKISCLNNSIHIFPDFNLGRAYHFCD